jgi:hypothetical protein
LDEVWYSKTEHQEELSSAHVSEAIYPPQFGPEGTEGRRLAY